MSMRRCEIVQQVQYLSEEQIKIAITGRRSIKEFAYILHDKDEYLEDVYAEENGKKVLIHKKGELKAPHWHVILDFEDGQQQQKEYIAKWFKIETQYVERIKSPKIEDAYGYLIHYNQPEKYQYDPAKVESSFDYKLFIEDNTMYLERHDEIMALIDKGIITRFNYENFVTIHEYVRYEKDMQKAFDYYEKKNNSINRNLTAIYIHGKTSTGKTELAKTIAAENGYSCFISSIGHDMLDGYEGQEAIVLNDLREDCGMSFNEILQMSDNYTNARGKSRFHNKSLSNCKMLFITTIFPMDTFLNYLDPRHLEDWVQFYRRFTISIEVKPDHIEVSQFNLATRSYVGEIILDNPNKDKIQKTLDTVPMTNEEMSNFLKIPMLPTDNQSDLGQNNNNSTVEEVTPQNGVEKFEEAIFKTLDDENHPTFP